MKKEKDTQISFAEAMVNQKSSSYRRVILTYISTCIIGLMILIIVSNLLISNQDKKLTRQVCQLVAEKMNNSIDCMTTTSTEIAQFLIESEFTAPQDMIDQMDKHVSDTDIANMGYITPDKNVIAKDDVLAELTAQDVLSVADRAFPVAISLPYDSQFSEKQVFTLFVHIANDGQDCGTIFVTYPISKVKKMANAEYLNADASIYLMNANTKEIIQCTETSEQDDPKSKKASDADATASILDDSDVCDAWLGLMEEGEQSAAVILTIDNQMYTQVFERVDKMDDWYVVVRIPNRSLSSTFTYFRILSIGFTLVLIIGSIFLMVGTHKRHVAEREMLKNLSINDPLTKVMNRRAFDFMGDQFVADNAVKSKGAFLFIDIDYFKQVNDTYGHDAGDQVLSGFAALCKDVFPKDTILARYGGDEFVALIPNLDELDAVDNYLNKLHHRLPEVKITESKVDAHKFCMHFSAGVAAYPDHGDNLKDLMKCADSALYTVKENGRDGYGWYKRSKH